LAQKAGWGLCERLDEIIAEVDSDTKATFELPAAGFRHSNVHVASKKVIRLKSWYECKIEVMG